MQIFKCPTALLLFTAILLAGYAPLSSAEDISAIALEQQMSANTVPFILDVRSADEYDAGHVPTAINIPHTEVTNRLDELPDNLDTEIIIYCRSGRRAAMAQATLEKAEFSGIRHLEGDFIGWQEAGLPVQIESAESGVE
ncbi:MAG: rhodanese-like domain-containing protein [Gammaproteobacteria bacterium]|nr:rhodanese-like domain-containing protein [Gammaproteobacteria bacterium]